MGGVAFLSMAVSVSLVSAIHLQSTADNTEFPTVANMTAANATSSNITIFPTGAVSSTITISPTASPWTRELAQHLRTANVSHLHRPRWVSLFRALYSQFGQDEWVEKQFGAGFKGYYVDIGAHDGSDMSNTQLLDEKGWKGVCVEAEPTNFQSRTCKLRETVVSDVTGQRVEFRDCKFAGTDGGNGGLSGVKGVSKADAGRRDGCPTVELTTTSIGDILATAGYDVPAVIDYVSLDIEGAELKVLQAFPFDKHCVRTWTVEHNNEEPKKTQIKQLLESRKCNVEATLDVDWLVTCPCH